MDSNRIRIIARASNRIHIEDEEFYALMDREVYSPHTIITDDKCRKCSEYGWSTT